MAKFKSRARSLDLLGRQQIAGIPTALNELFKNAHDAYADHVEVDFYRDHKLLLLRDDGLGMTLEDFEDRWLTLGTESKLETKVGISKPYVENITIENKRPTTGEKGIGRLAIAAIGPQVLVITRARRKEGLQDFICSFINWSMFELPAVDLDEVEIPIKTYKSLDDISLAEINSMKQELLKTIDRLEPKTDPEICQRIRKEVSAFQPPEGLLNVSGPRLDNGGTWFIIQQTAPQLIDDISGGRRTKGNNDAPLLVSALCGFTDYLFNDGAPIKAAFRKHSSKNGTEDLIGKTNYFSKEEYKSVDHHVTGHFDEYGNFSGKLSVYGEEPIDISLEINPGDKETACGPFKISFGYLQGNQKESLVSGDEFSILSKKCELFGGLFVYRDHIRILPFGRPDFDYFGIERRRTKSASTAFFSHRRMIGGIQLTRENNSSLIEKAGREGFITNKASSDFRFIVESFLIGLAQKFFSNRSEHAEVYNHKKESLRREHDLLARRAAKTKDAKEEFKKKLDKKAEYIEYRFGESRLQKALNSLIESVEKKIEHIDAIDDLKAYAQKILKIEADAWKEFYEIKSEASLERLVGVGLPRELDRQWNQFSFDFNDYVLPLLEKTKNIIDRLISDKAQAAKDHLDSKARLEASLISFKENKKADVKEQSLGLNTVYSQVKRFVDESRSQSKEKLIELDGFIKDHLQDISKQQVQNNFVQTRNKLERELAEIADEITSKYKRMQLALNSVLSSGDSLDDQISQMQAIESQNEALKDELEQNLEHVQLGMAIKVVNHEFSANVKGVRDSIKALKAWSDVNEDLQGLYEQLRTGFDHLDSYLNLFTPLEKRLRRSKTTITGRSIYDFINKLYAERFERHQVKLEVTQSFKDKYMETYPSVTYPVLVNLVDNSVYWLSVTGGDDKKIIFDANEEGFIVSDNGPGIADVDRDLIYDFGYTRKVGSGGGMGLYIAKTVLNKEGFDIRLISHDHGKDSGADFLITTEKKS